MNPLVADVVEALKKLAVELRNASQNNQTDTPLSSIRGWHHPALTREEIVEIPERLAIQIENAVINDISDLDESKLKQIPNRLNLLNSQQTIAHLFNGHAHQALPGFLLTIQWVERLFEGFLAKGDLESLNISTSLKRKIRSLQARVQELNLEEEGLSRIVTQIKSAHEAADSLPTDLADLQKARKQIDSLVKSARSDIETEIENEKSSFIAATASSVTKLNAIDKLLQNVEARSTELETQSAQISKLLSDSEEAYSVTVTKGLSGAFNARAESLAYSMWVWVAGLGLSLGIGVWTGSERIKALNSVVVAENPQIELIVIQLILSLLNLGAPIWFAWLSTKQIGQRFRLAEDYSFKATVAKAYEGYRREAARIDPMLEAKLLHSALNRLDEAPLRFVEEKYHSTPWQELIASPEFNDAINKIPELKDKFSGILKRTINRQETDNHG